MGNDCCTWEGVACDNRTGHVVKLDLHNPHYQFSYIGNLLLYNKWSLGGELRPSLLGLKHLNYLDLSMNNFGRIRIPEFMGSFQKLKYLNLSGDRLSGLIPHQLGNLSSLQYLDLSYNYYYENFEGLYEFLIIDNALWISHLSSLRYLNMTAVKFREGAHWLQALNMLPSIIEINSTIPNWLFNISSLEYLDLSFNNFWGIIPPAIKNLASLKFLHLSGNLFLEGKIPALLEGLCKLQYLGLSDINISKNLHEFDEVFTGCIKNSLETLHMRNTQLSGYLPDWLGDFRMLKILNLDNNSISGPISASLGRLAELVELYLGGNFLEGVMFEEQLANFTKLKYLDLSQIQLILNLTSDWIPPFQLQRLDIGSCKLGPRFPAWLWMHKNITDLDMSSTRISDTIPDWFWRSFSQMWWLDISSNGITGSVPDLTEFINLEYLNLSSNYF
ncbi:receptor-like protein EIX2 [Cocos nucifera]|nr:receptor-like protein EIX2 [Cocos nucifera]